MRQITIAEYDSMCPTSGRNARRIQYPFDQIIAACLDDDGTVTNAVQLTPSDDYPTVKAATYLKALRTHLTDTGLNDTLAASIATTDGTDTVILGPKRRKNQDPAT